MIGLATSPLWVIYILLGMLCLLLFDLHAAVTGMSTAQAEVARLSRTGLGLDPAGGLQAFDDVRLQRTEGSTNLTHGDVYAKVARQSNGVAELRFTATPPEILTYFEGLRS